MQLDNMRKSGQAPLCFDILVNNGLGCCARMMPFVVARGGRKTSPPIRM
jgi:hypothetical protein